MAFSLLGHHDIVIDGFTIEGFCDAGIQVRSRTIFTETGDLRGDNNAHDVTIRNNVVRGQQKLGIDVSAEGMIVVEGNEATGNGESGISIQSCVNAPAPEPGIDLPPLCRAGPSEPVIPVVSNNRIAGNRAHGIFVRDAESGLIQNNIVSENRFTGITLRAAPDVSVVNNLVVRNGEEGLAVGSADLASPNARIVNNTIYANGEWGIEIGSGGATSPGAVVLNNIVRGNAGGLLGIGVLNENAPRLSEVLRSTCGYIAGFNFVGDTYGPKTPRNVYDVQDDPLFVDPAGDDFRLQPGSPAIDAGSASISEIGLTGSTVSDGRPDVGRVDVGFHYGAGQDQVIQVPEPFMPVFVRAAGDDANGGKSAGDALATITAGARRARAGVTVVVGPGRYPECAIQPPADQGRAGFLADPAGRRTGERAGLVLVDAGACAAPGGNPGFLLVGACFATVDGFHVRGAFDDGIQVQTGSHFASIRNNVSFSNGARGIGRGINVTNARDVRIVNNLVYDNQGGGIQLRGQCATGDLADGTCDLAGSPRAVIHGNTAYANGFNGILIGVGTGVSSHASVRYNVVVANGENGIQVGSNDGRAPHLEGFVEASGFNVVFDNPYGAGTPVPPADREQDPLLVLPAGEDGQLGGDHFADDTFCLSQIAAGQTSEATEVIDYSDVTAEEVEMDVRSTRTDGVPDAGNLDPGFHYAARFTPGMQGDCDGDGHVAVSELILAVRIALGAAPVAACSRVDVNFNGTVTIDEVVGAVDEALTSS